MSNPISTLQQEVDAILLEEGSFSSIAWLLRKGYLDYVDYRNWRQGGAGYLEDHFKIALPQIVADLKLAHRYAHELKLEFSCQRYASKAQQPLRICRSATDEELFTTVYEPPKNRVQADLFFDSAPVFATQELIEAIVDRRNDAIPALLAQLKSFSPAQSSPFEQLLAQEEEFLRHPETGRKIYYLQHNLTPTAFEVLGRFANDFLIPYWQQVSLELRGRPFEPETPQEHTSFTAFQALDWRQVIDSIEREENWHNQALLLFRHAEACFKLHEETIGLRNWFRLFLRFPERAGQIVSDTANSLLLIDWRTFKELDPELEPALFPAWRVLIKPAIAKLLLEFHGDDLAHRALQLMCDLASHDGKGINESTLNLRAKLRQMHPALFAHYMAMHRELPP